MREHLVAESSYELEEEDLLNENKHVLNSRLVFRNHVNGLQAELVYQITRACKSNIPLEAIV